MGMRYWGARFPLEDWEKKQNAESNYARYKWMSRWVRGPKVLDFGCSHGSLVRFIDDKNVESYVGVDANPEAVRCARRLYGNDDSIQFRRDIPDNIKFNTIVLGEVLEHQESPVELLTLLRSRLDEDGVIVITVPHGFDEVSDHRQIFLTQNFTDMLTSAELGIVTIKFIDGRICCVAHKGYNLEFPDSDEAERNLSNKHDIMLRSYRLMARRYEALTLTWFLKGVRKWLISFCR